MRVLSLLATYQSIEDLLNIGAYAPGANLEYDLAVQTRGRIIQFLQQAPSQSATLEQSAQGLAELAAWIDLTEKTLRAQAAKNLKRPAVTATA